MKQTIGKTFRNERVELDYSTYEKCSFIKCEIYTNVGDFSLIDNDFSDCRLSLGPNARNIAKLIQLFFPDMPIWFAPEENREQVLQKMKGRLQIEGLV